MIAINFSKGFVTLEISKFFAATLQGKNSSTFFCLNHVCKNYFTWKSKVTLTSLGLEGFPPCNAIFWHLSQTAARQMLVLSNCIICLRELARSDDTRWSPISLQPGIHKLYYTFPLNIISMIMAYPAKDWSGFQLWNPAWHEIWKSCRNKQNEIKENHALFNLIWFWLKNIWSKVSCKWSEIHIALSPTVESQCR